MEGKQYATTHLDNKGYMHGGSKWKNLIPPALKAFITLALYIGLKCQPNNNTYWSQYTLFHSLLVANLITHNQLKALRRYLHIIDLGLYGHIDWKDPRYDKIHQTRWSVDGIQEWYKLVWNLGMIIMVDKMIICYKSLYCLICQFSSEHQGYPIDTN